MSDVQIRKFDWLRAVFAEPRIPDGEKVVLAYIANFSVRTDGDTFCVRQSTLADHCALSERTANSAVSRSKRLGYLALSRARQRGTGHHGADELRLTLPKLSEESSRHSTELDEETSHNSAKSDTKQTQELDEADAQSWTKEMQKLDEGANPSSCGNRHAPVLDNSSLNRFGGNAQFQPRVDTQAEQPVDDARANQDPPSQKNSEERKTAPDGASPEDDKKPRPQLNSSVHKLVRTTSIEQAGNPPPNRGDRLHDDLERSKERLAGISACIDCDDDGYLPDGTKCWHGKDKPGDA
jgi:hypothetical protein